MSFESEWEQYLIAVWESNAFWIACCLCLSMGVLWNIWSAWHFESQSFVRLSQISTVISHQKADPLEAPFFGTYIPNINDGSMTMTRLNQVVVGILFSNLPALSQVVLRSETGRDRIYKVGDELEPGIEIKAIQETGIVLSNHGKLEKLNMPARTLYFSGQMPSLHLKDVSK